MMGTKHTLLSAIVGGGLLTAPVMALMLAPGCSGMYSDGNDYEHFKEQQEDFAAQCTEAGGSAVRKTGKRAGFEGNGWSIDLSGDTVTDELIDAIVAKRKEPRNPVFELNFSGSTITDEQLAKLDAGTVLQQVFVLDLSNTAITDQGLDKCENVHCLEQLNLTGSKATEEGAKRLGERKVKHAQTPKPFKVPPKVTI